jgi:hypothetical protein
VDLAELTGDGGAMLAILMALACAPADDPAPAGLDTAPPLPGHNECLDQGQAMDADTCVAVVAADGRLPGQSYYHAGAAPPPDPDPRLRDPDYLWLRAQIDRCTCACCHTSSYGGPGAYSWDLDFRPNWIDSATDWSLGVLAGINPSENQLLPSEDPERVLAIVNQEIARRELANEP